MAKRLLVFVPERYILARDMIVQDHVNLGVGTMIPQNKLSQEVLNGRVRASIVTNRNLITVEEN